MIGAELVAVSANSINVLICSAVQTTNIHVIHIENNEKITGGNKSKLTQSQIRLILSNWKSKVVAFVSLNQM